MTQSGNFWIHSRMDLRQHLDFRSLITYFMLLIYYILIYEKVKFDNIWTALRAVILPAPVQNQSSQNGHAHSQQPTDPTPGNPSVQHRVSCTRV